MRKSLLIEFLEIERKLGRIHEHIDEFSDQIPDNQYSGDIFVPIDDLDDVEKINDELELEKEIPKDDIRNDDDIYVNMIPIPKETPQEIPDQTPEEPDFSDIDQPVEEEPQVATYDNLNNIAQTGNTDMSQAEQPALADPMMNGMSQELPATDPSTAAPVDPNAGMMDPNMGMAGGMMDPMSAGLLGMPEPLDPSSIGKMYILKKIYSRLLSVNENLSYLSSEKFEDLRKSVSEAIDHFQNVIANFDQFKDKLDEVIILFQRFLVGSVNKIEVLLSSDENSEEETENNEELNSRERISTQYS